MVKRKEPSGINLWRLTDVDRLFDRLYALSPTLTAGAPRQWAPQTDVFETKDDIVIKMDLAGVSRDDVKILLDEDSVVITGRREDAYEEETEYYHQVEIEYGYFRREISLPRAVAGERTRAFYRDGFLFVVLPRAEKPVTIHTTVEIL